MASATIALPDFPSLLPANYGAIVAAHLASEESPPVEAPAGDGILTISAAPDEAGSRSSEVADSVTVSGGDAPAALVVAEAGDVLVINGAPPTDKRSIAELRAACHVAGIPATGRKTVLQKRLAAHAAGALQV